MTLRGGSAVLLAACLAGVGACGLEAALPHYTGEQPSTASLASERLVVRQTVESSVIPGGIGAFYGDRLRYLEGGDPHDVNRVVRVETGSLTSRIAELGVQVGDTLIVTTKYDTTYYEATAPGAVPDWPGHRHHEYPVARHTLASVARLR